MGEYMSDSVKLNELFLGISDGAVEAKEEKFEELFYDPYNKYNELMSNNEKFLVLGNKGTGKTYLANYIMKKSDKKQKVEITYANDFWIYKLAKLENENVDEEVLYALCKWFLLDKIAHLFLKSHKFKSSHLYGSKAFKLQKLLKSVENEEVFKEIRKTDVRSTEFNISGSGQREADDEEKKSNSMGGIFNISKSTSVESERKKFVELIHLYEERVFEAIGRNDNITIIIDDLDELGNTTTPACVGKIIVNLITIAKEYNLKDLKGKCKIILLLRSDILDDLQAEYANLSKTKTSCAVELYWLFNSVNEQYEHPLMSMILHKIKASCKEYKDYDNKKLFNTLFPETIDNKKPLDYILDHGFGRPRDFVTFLNHAQKLSMDSTFFSAKILKEARKPYSADFYDELMNQTSYLGKAEYVKQCMALVAAIKQVSFVYNDIKKIYDDNKERYAEITNIDEAIELLYKLGVIGNSWKTTDGKHHTCWYYKKDAMNGVVYNKKFTIHYGLRKKFSL